MDGAGVLYCVDVMALIEQAAVSHARAREKHNDMLDRVETRIERLRDELEDAKEARRSVHRRKLTTCWQAPRTASARYWTPERRAVASAAAKRAHADRQEREWHWEEQELRRGLKLLAEEQRLNALVPLALREAAKAERLASKWKHCRIKDKAQLIADAERAERQRLEREAEEAFQRKRRKEFKAWLAQRPDLAELDRINREAIRRHAP